jgi:hypothetical protein
MPNVTISEAELDALIQQASTFVEQLEEVAHENFARAEQDYGEAVLYSHRLAMAAAIGVLRRFEKKTVAVPIAKADQLTHRLVLAMSFLQGIYLCYEAIGKGLYVQAAAVLRQEMETIAALVEARTTGHVKKIKGRGQQVGKGNIAWQMNRLHGGLCDATHLGNPALLDALYRSAARPEEGLVGRPIRLMPLYSKGDAINMLACQAGLIVQLFDEIHLVLMDSYGEGANSVENFARHVAFEYLRKAGYLIEEKQEK